jgi:hypothetical protein
VRDSETSANTGLTLALLLSTELALVWLKNTSDIDTEIRYHVLQRQTGRHDAMIREGIVSMSVIWRSPRAQAAYPGSGRPQKYFAIQ